MGAEPVTDLEGQIAQWRSYVQRRQAVLPADVDELEDHLRNQVGELEDGGLSEDEAFLVAVKRMGNLDALSREFAREHSDRLWKQLVLTPDPGHPEARRGDHLVTALAFAAAAAIAVKVPAVVGLDLGEDPGFYLRNLGLFVLPFLAGYFARTRRLGARALLLLALPFVLAAVVANVYPFTATGATVVLTAIHLPVALWFVVGVAYTGGEWRSDRGRMDFIRFTGEWVIYYALIALGGGVLLALTLGAFGAIGLDAEEVAAAWLIPCGAAGAVVVAAWLVEAKQSVIENMAPVLTRVFTPLFTLMLLVFLVAIAWTRPGIGIERDVLIIFDLLLVLVLGLVLYSISARDPGEPPGAFDRLQLVLLGSALLVDLLVLVAMVGRLSAWGPSPNKIAALGLNVVLLVNLAWSARLEVDILRGRRPFDALARWHTGYLPVYAGWAAVVAVAFPPLFAFS